MCIKSEFSAKITLPYFIKDKETLLQTDDSKKGFGAVLIQDNKPVYFASRTLTPSEKNYQNLECECMSGEWKSSTTCMEDISHCRLTKGL